MKKDKRFHEYSTEPKVCKYCGGQSTRIRNGYKTVSTICTKCYTRRCNNAHLHYPEWQMWWNAKERAKKKGIEFAITVGDAKIPKLCPILGIELRKGTRHDHENSPTLDRIDLSKGYVPGNVAVISHRANRPKGDATLKELMAICLWMASKGMKPI